MSRTTKPAAPDPWRNRIVGQGDEAPDQLLANPSNWRVHPMAQREALAAVLDEVGWVQRVIVNKTTQHVVDGHLRVALALSRDEPTIPVNYVELDVREESLVLAALDPIAAMATTDKDKLRELLEQAQVTDDQLRAAISDAAGLQPKPAEGKTDPDAVPDERATEIQRGDLFALGDHRLLCGDSTKADDIDILTTSEPVDVCATDPPYGVNLDYKSHDDGDLSAYWSLMADWVTQARKISSLIVCTVGNKHNNEWFKRFDPDSFCVWFDPMKQSPHKAAYLCKSELVLVFGKVPERWAWDTWQVNSVRGDGLRDLHPCPKPVELWLEIIKPVSYKTIYDPFVGSGTTIIAAEQLNRRCYAIEIEPTYCQVTIDRWEAFTGQKAEKVQP